MTSSHAKPWEPRPEESTIHIHSLSHAINSLMLTHGRGQLVISIHYLTTSKTACLLTLSGQRRRILCSFSATVTECAWTKQQQSFLGSRTCQRNTDWNNRIVEKTDRLRSRMCLFLATSSTHSQATNDSDTVSMARRNSASLPNTSLLM